VKDLPIVLASASPRRAELLTQIGISFTVRSADIDESIRPGEAPAAYVQRMAMEKSAAIAATGAITLSADTVVVKDHQILGKPANQAEAVGMLCALSDRWHEVMTCIVVSNGLERESELVTTRVCFGPISEAQAIDYWHTGEPADKAGGYGIQGIGGIFACKIEGSYSAVVGLPLAETERLLKRFGIDTWRRRIDG
jgi:septum formation protein